MNNIRVAYETIKITATKRYVIRDKEVVLPNICFQNVAVISPKIGKDLIIDIQPDHIGASMCEYSVINMDSFRAAEQYDNPLVLNFANVHTPGGGFLAGAVAQEEALCRASTLYASISSKEAAEMYRYNNRHLNCVESDYMLLSKNVIVFRDVDGNLLGKPYRCGVLTAAAPNRRGLALFASKELTMKTFIRRITILLSVAAKYGYKDLVLGAWGCGLFGNKPRDVADYFRQVLIEMKYGRLFDHVCFAIYGPSDNDNYHFFKEVFKRQ